MAENREQSEFNDALGYLGRLNGLFYSADEASITMDVQTWFHCLLAIYRELSPMMNDDELDYASNRVNLINPKVNNSIREYARTGRLYIHNDLYMDLNKFEIWLRKIMKSSGLLIRTADDPSLALM